MLAFGVFFMFVPPSPGRGLIQKNLEGLITMHRREIDKKNWEKFSFTVLMTTEER